MFSNVRVEPLFTFYFLLLTFSLVFPASAQTSSDPETDPSAVTDRHRSIDTGADSHFGFVTMLAGLEDRGFDHLPRDRRLALPLRIARTVLLDHPIAVFMLVLQHEAYGHGGRARELGAHAVAQGFLALAHRR